jgi:PAS domain S-box-containing protein
VHWTVAVVLIVGSAVLPGQGLSPPTWHVVVEVAATTLAFVLGSLALVRYYSRRQTLFLFIGTGFLATGLLDAVHAVLTAGVIPVRPGTRAEDLSAWSWLQARVFLSLFLFVSVLPPAGGGERSGASTLRLRSAGPVRGRGGRMPDDRSIYATALVLVAAVAAFFGLAPLASAIHPAWVLPRPAELIPGVLFAGALVGYLRRGEWRQDAFQHWLVVSLLINALAQVAFMARSAALHDPFFDVAHLLKLASYLAVFAGLLISIFGTFRREGRALLAVGEANEALAAEIRVRREAEAVLQRSEERLRSFLESAHDLIQSSAPDGRILFVNRAWEGTLGYTRDDLTGMRLADLLHHDCRDEVLRLFDRVLAGERVERITAEFIARNGDVVVCSGSAVRHVVDGRPKAVQAIFRDVTAQKRTERELASSRANIEALVENTGDAIWSVDTRHRLITFNSAFALAVEARTGREPHRGDLPDAVFGPRDAAWYRALYERGLKGERFSLLREESVVGQPRTFEIFCNPVTEAGGATGAVMFGRDVTRRLQAEEALRVSKEEAEAANRAKSQFLANMSHELRTPLNSVIGFANILLKNKRGNLSSQDLGFLERIMVNGRHLLALINEVLDLAKVEAGRMELELEPVGVAELVRETVAQLEGQAREKRVRLLARTPVQGARPLETDRAKLKQVLINLLGNAIKFSEGGEVTVNVETDPATNRVTALAVQDTGIGIPPDRLETIFGPFQQADGSTSREYGGTGLGLTISRSICQLLGYELDAASAVGEGSTFTIRVEPRPDPPLLHEPGPEAREVLEAVADDGYAPRAMKELRVLVIDDEADSRVVLTHYLKDLGCRVLTAASAEEGLELARRERPNLITLDLMMPGMGGWEALRILKEDEVLREIPVVVVSIVAAEDRGRLLGAVDLLTKPVEREDLLRVIWRNLVRQGGGRVLVIDDDPDARLLMEELLGAVGLEVCCAENGYDGLRIVDE